VRRLGYSESRELVTVPSGATAALDVSLRPEPLRLDEIVVVGMPRETSRRAVGNAVTTVPVADITQDVPLGSFQDLLTGRMPGIRYSRSSGNLGVGSPMTLRGIGSFDLGRSQPLVYVDGIRVSTDIAAGPPVGYGRSVNVLDDFGAEEIESVEIIQGAAAGSLYGSEAASGVIHIRTRQGQLGGPELSMSIRQGVNYLSDPAGRLGTQWLCPTNPFPNSAGCGSESELRRYNMYDEANTYIRDGYFDWPTENLFSNGPSQSVGLSVRGGTPTTRYFLSAAFDDERGMIWFNRDRTSRLRGNVRVAPSDRISIDVSTGYSSGSTRFMGAAPGNGGVWQDLIWSNGYYLNRITPFDSPGNCVGTACAPIRRLGGFQEHLPTDVADVEATRDYTRLTGSVAVAFTSRRFGAGPVTGAVSSRAVVGLDKSWDVNRNLFPLEEGTVPESVIRYCSTCTFSAWGPVYVESATGLLNYERPISSSTTVDWGISADLVVGDALDLGTSAGVQHYAQERELFANWGSGFASPSSRTINQIAQSAINTVYNRVENKSIGFYVQQEASFRGRVFLTGAVRLDQASSFGDRVPMRTYPKVAGAWIVSSEDFWGVGVIESLRVRGAWGKAGRVPAALAGHSTFVTLDGFTESLAVRPTSVGNPDIEPEVSSELEAGFDASALDGAVAASFTHHWRKNEGAILEVLTPSALGISAPQARNLGRIDTWGWEAQVSTRLYETQTLSLGLDVAADHIGNEIVSLGAFPGTSSIRIGLPFPNELNDDLVLSAAWDAAGPVTNVFGQGISALCDRGIDLAPDPSAPDAAKYGRVAGGAAVPCQTIPNRNLVMGPAYATYTLAVTPRVGLFGRRLQLYALAEGQYGRLRDAHDREFSHVNANTRVSRLHDDPEWVYGYVVGDDTKRSLFDADFWKLREIGARWALPPSFLRDVGAEQGSLSIAARNLWTIWRAQSDIYGVPITDPEFGAPSIDGDGNYYETPPLTNVSVTLRVTF
jgi:TonB-dependent SusC/RagA subfamily outer membrane receptor